MTPDHLAPVPVSRAPNPHPFVGPAEPLRLSTPGMEAHVRPITDVLREIRRGTVVDRASEELAAVVRAVLDTDKPGKLSIELAIKPNGDGAVEISAKLKPTIPQGDLPSGLFFADLEGDLHRDNPKQPEMFVPTDALGDRASGRA